jgi:hypothetical protein
VPVSAGGTDSGKAFLRLWKLEEWMVETIQINRICPYRLICDSDGTRVDVTKVLHNLKNLHDGFKIGDGSPFRINTKGLDGICHQCLSLCFNELKH